MNIRTGTHNDISQIIKLLKISLGESLMPKSESYWQWKHIENPFGPSPVLVAEEGGQLVGVRAFMRWEWRYGNNILKAIRAVDTATHPDYQGKGIFKKLTLELLQQCKNEGLYFIFNTPNTKSRQGYLKMGWQDAGRLPVKLIIGNPLGTIMNKLSPKSVQNEIPLQQLIMKIADEEELNMTGRANFNYLSTHLTINYLIWRYCSVPIVKYYGIYNEENLELVVYRIKSSSNGKELRVTDYFSNRQLMSSVMLNTLRQKANEAGALYLTFSGRDNRVKKGIKLGIGPIVTVCDLNYPEFSNLIGFKHWKPSLGDLELF